MGEGFNPKAYEEGMKKMEKFVNDVFASDRPVLTNEPQLTSEHDLARPSIPKILEKLKNSDLELEMVQNSPDRLIYRVRDSLDHLTLYRKVSDFITTDLAFSCDYSCGDGTQRNWQSGFSGTGMGITVSKCGPKIVLDIETRQYD